MFGCGWRPDPPICARDLRACRCRYSKCCGVIRWAVTCSASAVAAANLLKVIWHDGQGACLFTKRLERGRLLWPGPADGAVMISPTQLGYLLSGIDWRHPQETWRPTLVG